MRQIRDRHEKDLKQMKERLDVRHHRFPPITHTGTRALEQTHTTCAHTCTTAKSLHRFYLPCPFSQRLMQSQSEEHKRALNAVVAEMEVRVKGRGLGWS